MRTSAAPAVALIATLVAAGSGMLAALATPAATAAPTLAPTVAQLARITPGEPQPQAWIVVDADTGRVLAGRDVHTPYSPASMTKVMTALTAIERLPPSTPVIVTADAQAKGLSNLTTTGMSPGQHWSLDTTIGLMLVVSANDAAYSLATTTSGSLAAFANAETATAHQLGLRDSTFSDPAGLDDSGSYNGGPRMSAFDVADTVRNALAVPELANWARTPQFSFTDPAGAHHTVVNHNKLLLAGPNHYDGATGFKTGFTHRAGNTLVSTATRGGRTIISVVMNTYDPYGWSTQLLNDGFGTPATAPGTGESLPPVSVITYAQRASDRTAFLALAQGSTGVGSTASTLPNLASITTYHTTTTTAAPASTAAPTTGAKHSGTTGGGVNHSSTAGHSSSGGIGWIVELVVVLFVVAAIAVMVRRQAVKRRRARRLARRRATQAALRRGSLPVVDGRYRPGMRTGKPVQSHVKIHRSPGDAR